MPPGARRARPLHEQIHDHYAALIRDGGLGDGVLLPSARQVAAAWGVSAATADRALAWLVTDGLARRDRRGTVAVSGRLVASPAQRSAFASFPAGQVTVTAAEFVPRAPAYIRPLLGLDEVPSGDMCPVARREQVRRDASGQPFMLSVEWYHPRFLEAVPELLDAAPLPEPGGGVELIESRTGITVVRYRTAAEARHPKDDGRERVLLHALGTDAVSAQVYTWFSEADAVCYGEYVTMPGIVTEAEWEIIPDR